MKLIGWDAIRYAVANDMLLRKYADPVEDAREGVTPEQAQEIATDDPRVIYIEITGEHLVVDEESTPAHLGGEATMPAIPPMPETTADYPIADPAPPSWKTDPPTDDIGQYLDPKYAQELMQCVPD